MRKRVLLVTKEKEKKVVDPPVVSFRGANGQNVV